MEAFKGTKKIYPVEYSGFIVMNNEPFYEGDNVLDWGSDFEGNKPKITEIEARANAKLFASAPQLLEALDFALEILQKIDNPIFSQREAIKKAESAIKKASE